MSSTAEPTPPVQSPSAIVHPPLKGEGAQRPVLRLSNITKRFGPLTANDAISLDLAGGETVALLGENGAGKTTLMNILFGHYVADEGSVEAFGKPLPAGDPRAALNAGIGMVHQHFTLADNMTVMDNITLGTESLWSPRFDRRFAHHRIKALGNVFGLEIDSTATVSTLSVGERQRVEILKALYRDAKILILDEPTAVLTPSESEALFRTLKIMVAKGLSIIFISHKLAEVMAVSDRVLVLRGGKLVGERRTAATNRSELATLMVGQELVAPAVKHARPGPPALILDSVTTPARGTRVRLEKVSLTLRASEIVGLAGVSGNGQSVLAALISGAEMPESGSMVVRSNRVTEWSERLALDAGVGRIPEDRHAVGTIGDMSVTENLIAERYRTQRFSSMGFMKWGAAGRFAEQIINEYDVKCPSPDARVRLLSGGNMQKLILGRALDPEPSIVLANQPTRGLDVGAVAYVHGRLIAARARAAAVLLISEDLDEILTLSDRIVVMSKGKLSRPSHRGERSVREISELMAGHGLEAA
jgi:ABC-type uncharacterized transport system ATPase subunit